MRSATRQSSSTDRTSTSAASSSTPTLAIGVRPPDRGGHPVRHLHQHLVSRGSVERTVNGPETVEVDDHHAMNGLTRDVVGDRLADLVEEHLTAHQAGEPVVERSAQKLVLDRSQWVRCRGAKQSDTADGGTFGAQNVALELLGRDELGSYELPVG